jgi:hypothetical protein
MKLRKTLLFLLVVLTQTYFVHAQTTPRGTIKSSSTKPVNQVIVTKPIQKNDTGILTMPMPAGYDGSVIKNYKRTSSADNSVLKQTYHVYESMLTKPLNPTAGNTDKAKPKILSENADDPQRDKDCILYCTTKTQTISAANLSEFGTVFSKTEMLANLYPGAMYHIDDFYNGNFNPIKLERNGMTLTTSVHNLENGASYVNVGNPNYANLSNGVANLFKRHSNNEGEIGYEGFYYNMYSVESLAEVDFALNAGGHYLMVSASNSFSSQDKKFHKYLLIDGYKKMFSITATTGLNTTRNGNSSSMNSMELMLQGDGLLKDPSQLTKDMVFIDRVTYGARVIALVDLDISDKTVADKFSGGAEWQRRYCSKT